MAERRSVSKCISISEKVNMLPDIFDMLLFTWMIPHADDFGRLAGSPAKVKALVVPMLDKSIKDVEQSLRCLHEAKLIIWYEVDGEKVVQIVNFEDHQQGLHKRTKSKFPEAPDETPCNSGNAPDDSRKFREIPSEQNRTEGKGREEKGTEQKGTDDVSVPTFDNPHMNRIQASIQKYSLKCKGIGELEKIGSYIGLVDVEVIEHAIQEAEKKHVPYAISIIDRLIREEKTTKESIMPKAETSEKQAGHHHERASPTVYQVDDDDPITQLMRKVGAEQLGQSTA